MDTKNLNEAQQTQNEAAELNAGELDAIVGGALNACLKTDVAATQIHPSLTANHNETVYVRSATCDDEELNSAELDTITGGMSQENAHLMPSFVMDTVKKQ